MTDLDTDIVTHERAAAKALGRCRWCGLDVAWLTSDATGGRSPIDVKPRPDGNVVVVGPDADRYHVLHKGETTTRPRYVSHWMTCAKAKKRGEQ